MSIPSPQKIQQGMENNLATILATVFDRNKQDFNKGIHSLKNILDSSTTDNETINNLNGKLELCNAAKEKIEKSNTDLIKANTELNNKVKVWEASYNDLKNQCDINEKVNNENFDKKLELDDKIVDQSILSEENEELKKKLKNLQIENISITQLKIENDKLKTQVSENNLLKTQLQELIKKNTNLEKLNAALKKENDTQKGKLSEKDKYIETIVNELNALRNADNIKVDVNSIYGNDNNNPELESLKQKLSELEADLTACKNDNIELSKINGEMATMKTKIIPLLSQLTEFHVNNNTQNNKYIFKQ
jgi:hypothetical protein